MKSFLFELLEELRVVEPFVLKTILKLTYVLMVILTAITIYFVKELTYEHFIAAIIVEFIVYFPSSLLIYWIFKDPYS